MNPSKNQELLKNLEPQRVFYHFANLSNIPRGSSDEDGVREYILNLAKEHNLPAKKDTTGNIIVYKPKQNSNSDKTVVLQDHMDMVNEVELGYEHDFKKDPLDLKIDGEWLVANKTTLGADNGLGLSMLLSLIEDKEISHPNLELLFTYDEEVGLTGAANVDPKDFHGDYLINLDTEEEEDLYIGCAGGAQFDLNLKVEFEKTNGGNFYKISINNLLGGHSGADIHLERANSIKILASILNSLSNQKIEYSICKINGGNKLNAIPRDAFAIIESQSAAKEILKKSINNELINLKHAEPGITITLEETSKETERLSPKLSKKLILFLLSIHSGIYEMNHVVENLVETSNNLGAIKMSGDEIYMGGMFRSMDDYKKDKLKEILLSIFESFDEPGFKYNIAYEFPAWKPVHSELVNKFIETFEKMYDKKPETKAIHAGLETAYFAHSMLNTQMISFGPTIKDAHSPREKALIPSVERTYKILLELLKSI